MAAFTAASVYAYHAGGAGLVGILGLARGLPAALLVLLVTSWSDHVRRERMLIATVVPRALMLGASAAVMTGGGQAVLVVVLVALEGGLASVFRQEQAALLPWLARTPDELTSANTAAGVIQSGRRRERLRLVQQGPRGGELAAAGEHLRPGCPPPGLGVDIGGPGSYLGFLRHHPAARGWPKARRMLTETTSIRDNSPRFSGCTAKPPPLGHRRQRPCKPASTRQNTLARSMIIGNSVVRGLGDQRRVDQDPSDKVRCTSSSIASAEIVIDRAANRQREHTMSYTGELDEARGGGSPDEGSGPVL